MSDFLGNLVARSLSTVAQISPRLPSLFEPPPSSKLRTGMAAWQGTRNGEQDQTEVGSTAAPAVVPRSEERTQPAVPSPGDGPLRDEATGPAPYRGRQTPPGEPARVGMPSSVPSTRRQIPPSTVQPLPEPSADEPTAPEPVPPVPVEALVSQRETLPQEAPSPAVQALTTRERVPIVVRPQMRFAGPAESAAPEVEQPTPGPETPPTIRVTIGRVEVRAVMPTTPEPATAPRNAPRLSLDDYLQQRSGGSP